MWRPWPTSRWPEKHDDAVDALVYLILGPGRRWHRAAEGPTWDRLFFKCACSNYNSRNSTLFMPLVNRDIGGRLWLANT
jgi:hypothetical protein